VAEAPAYAILGRGRWAKIVRGILADETRHCTLVDETRLGQRESEAEYKRRLAARMTAYGATIAWLCTPPGPHVPLMIEAAIEAGLHAIIEKPWLYSQDQTRSITELAHSKGLLIGVHHEYCLLDEIRTWRRSLDRGKGLRFSGRFSMDRPDRIGIPAIDNFGCHLLAMREYAVPESELAGIDCAYEEPDERRVWLEDESRPIASIDFLGTSERIIQRYISEFEAALDTGSFPFDLDFAQRVAVELATWKKKAGAIDS
jgi:predicted dehydrogenase